MFDSRLFDNRGYGKCNLKTHICTYYEISWGLALCLAEHIKNVDGNIFPLRNVVGDILLEDNHERTIQGGSQCGGWWSSLRKALLQSLRHPQLRAMIRPDTIQW